MKRTGETPVKVVVVLVGATGRSAPVEDMAVEVVPGDGFRVFGPGAVMVFEGRVTHSNGAHVDEGAVLALIGSAVHVLPRGYGLDPGSKRPLLTDGEAVSVKPRE